LMDGDSCSLNASLAVIDFRVNRNVFIHNGPPIIKVSRAKCRFYKTPFS